MATTLPEVLSNSSLPSTTKLAGETNPLIESRSCLRTTTFLWVEGMESKQFPVCSADTLVRVCAAKQSSARTGVSTLHDRIFALSVGNRTDCAFTVAKL